MTKLIFVIALVGLIIVVVPLATIWSLNTLFPVLAIAYSVETWFAAVVLGSVVGGTTGVSFKK
jgi:hypothetical protein